MTTIHVIKRNGERAPLDIAKIQRQVKNCCTGIDGVSPSMIELRAQIQFTDGMTTETIDQLLLQAMVGLIDETENPEVTTSTISTAQVVSVVQCYANKYMAIMSLSVYTK